MFGGLVRNDFAPIIRETKYHYVTCQTFKDDLSVDSGISSTATWL